MGVLVSNDRQLSTSTTEEVKVLKSNDILLKADDFLPTNCDNILSIPYTKREQWTEIGAISASLGRFDINERGQLVI